MSALTLGLTLFLALVSPAYTSNLHRRQSNSVTSNCKHDFALTWNDGPYYWTEEIVDEFDCVGGTTTFFVNGNYEGGCIYSDDNVERLRYAFESGHQIASGSWSHADFSALSNAEIDVEIQRLDEALIKILGVRPKFFRAPSSIPDSAAQYISQTYGKTIITDDVDSNDGSGSSEDVYQFYFNLAQQAGQPHLALNHETSAAALDALDMGTINLLGQAGIKLVTVAQCLDSQAYDVVGGFGNRDASWTCDGTWTPSTALTSSQCAQTYTAGASDKTCDIVAAKFGLTASDIYFANPSWLNCADIWQNTPICIPPKPTPVTTDPVNCVQTYKTVQGDTCTTIAAKFSTSPGAILAANTWLSCNSIWTNTPVCIPPPTISSTRAPSSTSTSTSSCASTYSAAQGDTCSSIASKFGLSAAQILNANRFLDCTNIWAYTPICIPTATVSSTSSVPASSCASTYTAVAGDSCNSIGSKYGLTGAQILAANTFLDCSNIWAYTPVCIPAGTGSTSTSTSTTSSSTSTSTTSSSTSTSNTPAPSCVSTYTSVAGDSCSTIGSKYSLSGDQIHAANPFLDCNNIWAWTPICIPPGATNPISTQTSTSSASTTSSAQTSCVTTYTAGDNETCITVANRYGLSATDIYNANTFVGCDDIWKNTPLCIPPGGRGCTNTISSWPGATCKTIASAYGTTEANVQFWNSFVSCNDIWTNTPICVSH